MGKSKRNGGISGVSRFVFESMKSDASSSGAPNTSKKTYADHTEYEVDEVDAELPTKRRKGNDGLAVAEKQPPKDTWVTKYDASGLVPHYTDISQVPEHLHKYFSQRYRFFSLYSEQPGCLLDEEGWYSVTPELLANQIAERCRCDTILDAFCGVGGNAIAFAKTCQRVIALDTSPTRLALARHNAQIYGVADRIEFILADYISFANAYLSRSSSSENNGAGKRKIDVVFLSPPWGGPAYLSGSVDEPSAQKKKSLDDTAPADAHPSYSLSSIQPIHGADLFKLTRGITKNVAYYVPRNTRLDEIGALLTDDDVHTDAASGSPATIERVEVEEEWMGNKLKALTCFFGGLVAGQESMF